MNKSFQKIQQQSTSSLIVEQIIGAIQRGEFSKGERLPSERRLSEMLGVSRPTLREAIAALAILGILDNQQGSGTYVRTTSIDENLAEKAAELLKGEGGLLHALEALLIIEPEVVAMAAEKAGDKELDIIKFALDEIRERIQEESFFKESGMKFRMAIVQSIKNPVIEHICLIPLSIYYSENPPWWDIFKEKIGKPEILNSYYENYKRIYELIKARDSQRAYTEMKKHLLQVKNDLQNP